MRWHNEYNVGTLLRPGAQPFASPDEAVDQTAFSDGAASVIGTPDDLVQRIRRCSRSAAASARSSASRTTGPIRENTLRSWDLVARYVIPEINGYLRGCVARTTT